MKFTFGGHDEKDPLVQVLIQIREVLVYIHQEFETTNTWLHVIADALRPQQVTDFRLYQLSPKGAPSMITGTVVGTTSTFQIGLVPPSGAVPLQSGPVVSVDDTLVTLGPVAADGTFTAAVDPTDAGTSYNLTISGVNGAGTPITHAFNVPILPQPSVQVTDFSLNQLS